VKSYKIKARHRRRLRRDLVHSAGCAIGGCSLKDEEVVAMLVSEALELGVRIPRSFKK
jgi:hypothetical protein